MIWQEYLLSRTRRLLLRPRACLVGPVVRPRIRRGPSRRASRPRKGAGPSEFFVSGDAPLARVGVIEAVVISYEFVRLVDDGYAIPAPREVVDRE